MEIQAPTTRSAIAAATPVGSRAETRAMGRGAQECALTGAGSLRVPARPA